MKIQSERFARGEIEFPDDQHLVIIVGQNNSGKTTLLRAIKDNQKGYLIKFNRTVDNSTQTFVTSPPKPYPTMSGYNPWQARVDGKL